MNLMWFEIKFNEIELGQGKDEELIDEIRKLHRILAYIDGVALYAGKYRKNIGQKYFLSIPDNPIGRNLLQYFKLKNYLPVIEPDLNGLVIKCGNPLQKTEETIIKPELTSTFILN